MANLSRHLAACGFIFLCVPESTATAAETAADESYGFSVAQLQGMWAGRQQAAARGDFTQAATFLQGISAAKHRSGWPDFPVMADALVVESRAAASAGDRTRAAELAGWAVDLAPHYIAPRMAEVSANWAAGKMGPAAKALSHVLRLLVSEPPLLWARLGDMALWLSLGAVGACMAFAMAGVYRHSGALLHEVAAHVPGVGAGGAPAALVLAVPLLLPALLRLGIVWTCWAWLLLLMPFLRGRERTGAVVAIAMLSSVVACLPMTTKHFAYSGSRAEALYLTLRDGESDVAATRLAGFADLQPVEECALGLRARWSGDARRAVTLLKAATAGGITSPHLTVALANALFWAGDAVGAINMYQNLLRTDPENVLAVFNLSQLQLFLSDPQGGATAQRAMSLNPALARRLAEYSRHSSSRVVDPEVPRSVLEAAAIAEADAPHYLERISAVRQVWRGLGGPTRRETFFVATGLAVCWWWLSGKMAKGRFVTRGCRRCGVPACRRCEPHLADDGFCSACHAVYAQPKPDALLRIRKEIDSHRYGARMLTTQRVFNFLVAGGGQLLRGQSAVGLLLTTVFLSLILGLACGLGWLPEPVPAYALSVGVLNVLGGLLAFGIYVFAWVDGFREEGQV